MPGNTRLLNAFLDDLRKIQGIKVRVSFSKDLNKEGGSLHRGASWWVKYKQTMPETIVVRVNLGAKEIDAEKLELQLDKSPKEEPAELLVTFWGADRDRQFDVHANGRRLASVNLDGSRGAPAASRGPRRDGRGNDADRRVSRALRLGV